MSMAIKFMICVAENMGYVFSSRDKHNMVIVNVVSNDHKMFYDKAKYRNVKERHNLM